jgi:TrmH family RNA methyltransferase
MVSKSTVKYIQSLQQKKFRDADNVFVAEGPKLVRELFASGTFRLKAAYSTATWMEEIYSDRETSEIDPVFEVSEDELERMSGFKTANKCLAVFEKRISGVPVPTDELMLMLDDIQDPGNLGTIIRTADWFGVSQIVCSKATADCYNPKVVQSTMASLAHVELLYTDLESWLDQHEEKQLLCATLHGEPLSTVEKAHNQVLVIGNESKGINKELQGRASHLISIPKFGRAESLNAAVATGIILSHFSGMR